MINYRTSTTRRQRRATTGTATAIAALAAITAITACGSSSESSTAPANSNQAEAQAQQGVLDFARCMRSHGVSNFPDDLDFQNVPGLNPASPAFKTAQTACQHLLPAKTPPPASPSARTHAQLVRLATCLRAHGYPTIPDPRPNPPPTGGSPNNPYGTLYGQGDYWIGIPVSINAHGAAFVATATACGATGVGR